MAFVEATEVTKKGENMSHICLDSLLENLKTPSSNLNKKKLNFVIYH